MLSMAVTVLAAMTPASINAGSVISTGPWRCGRWKVSPLDLTNIESSFVAASMLWGFGDLRSCWRLPVISAARCRPSFRNFIFLFRIFFFFFVFKWILTLWYLFWLLLILLPTTISSTIIFVYLCELAFWCPNWGEPYCVLDVSRISEVAQSMKRANQKI